MAEVFFLLFEAYKFQPQLSAGQERRIITLRFLNESRLRGRMLGIMW
ncbi:MAG: hypothetical protein ACYDEF_16530 [Methanosarcina sp.]